MGMDGTQLLRKNPHHSESERFREGVGEVYQ